ncbi:hypothetical protein [Nocardia suismassiliense]|uniref:hypothetical protein n=1 Tax=Nocardia suismassiliense TaxID=2077092 RepID=UPI001F23576B|nr:hypothetical protein [Nocardia suismassiliense]
MTNPDLTLIAVLLDRSGSMQSIKSDTEGGFSAFIEEQRKLPKTIEVTLAQFDTEYECVYANRPVARSAGWSPTSARSWRNGPNTNARAR